MQQKYVKKDAEKMQRSRSDRQATEYIKKNNVLTAQFRSTHTHALVHVLFYILCTPLQPYTIQYLKCDAQSRVFKVSARTQALGNTICQRSQIRAATQV